MEDLTTILRRINTGDDSAYAELLPRVYKELRDMARRQMANERNGHTLSATALVHEAYLKLAGNRDVDWRDRAHFYGAAAESMRRILIDLARRRKRSKRGGDRIRIPLSAVTLATGDDASNLLVLNEALTRLGEVDERMARVVTLRFFAGLDVEETAQALGVSRRTVKREWACARAWLYRELGGSGEAP